MTTTRLTGLRGVAAVAVYVVATGVGSILDPDSSQIRQWLLADGATTGRKQRPD